MTPRSEKPAAPKEHCWKIARPRATPAASNDQRVGVVGWIAATGLVMSLGCAPAQAASANEVLPACKLYLSVVDKHGTVSQSEISHLLDAGECLGAVYAMLTVSHTLAEPLKFCPPVEFDSEQGVRVVVAYIESRPGRGREDFTTLALEALRSKWPCQ
jgi:hypothetical protein